MSLTEATRSSCWNVWPASIAFECAGRRADCLTRRARAEHVHTRRAEVVPPRHSEAQVFLHRLAEYHALRIVVLDASLFLLSCPS